MTLDWLILTARPQPSIALFAHARGLLAWVNLWNGWWLPSISFTIAFFGALPKASIRRAFVLS